ncbi:MAG: hypothetical protein HY347_07555 [candidate division NC10 bacterium]|nr:hypothetical protein [candidate division NC10 bacterium]
MGWTELLQAIERNRTSGAFELTEKAVQATLLFVKGARGLTPERFLTRFSTFTWRLLQAQPSMASLLNLVNALWLTLEGTREGEIRKMIEVEAKAFLTGMRTASEQVTRRGVGLLQTAEAVLIYSYSLTVMNTLLLAKRQRARFSVLCSEGRPAGEGLRLAKLLTRKGISVTLVVDAALPGLVREADLCLMGADALLPSGLVNKVGTYALALAARTDSVPFYVLCDSRKFLPKPLERFFTIREERPEEIWRRSPKGVMVKNRLFERTPLRLLTGVISEEGLLDPDEVRKVLQGRKVARGLFQLAKNSPGP